MNTEPYGPSILRNLEECDFLGKHVQSFIDGGSSAPPSSRRETGRTPRSPPTLDSGEQAPQRLIDDVPLGMNEPRLPSQ